MWGAVVEQQLIDTFVNGLVGNDALKMKLYVIIQISYRGQVLLL